ncbi:MAG: hypothetical protein Q7T57_04660, partial [Dehalococcoidales bacterium]|nr:hypothetical protein [Dehalococcoidales bacterium]
DDDDDDDDDEPVDDVGVVAPSLISPEQNVYGTPIRGSLKGVSGSPASTMALNDAAPSSAQSSPMPPKSASKHAAADARADARAATATFTFSSSSPDEIALCESLDRCGLTLVGRKGNQITIRYTAVGAAPIFIRYTIKATLEFTSTRARMDVVVLTPDGRTKFFVKGSDQQVMRMIVASAATTGGRAAMDPTQLLEITSLQLSAFAKTGSRTLLMAGRTLSPSQSNHFQSLYDDAANSLNDRELLIEKAFHGLEQEGLELLGSSAVEDQLQGQRTSNIARTPRIVYQFVLLYCNARKDSPLILFFFCSLFAEGVPEAVDFLLQGGLKLMVLTGDKLDTAISIGHQCNLLQPYMRVLMIGASTSQENIGSMLKENLRIVTATPPTDEARAGAELARVRMGGDPLTPLPDPTPSSVPLLGYALAIDGSSLEVCLRHYKEDFIALFLHMATIVSYRSTPKQKALAVQVVKESLGKTTLAIGDGANVSARDHRARFK